MENNTPCTKKTTPLPKLVITLSTLIMIFSIMVYSSVLSYLPHLVKTFHTPEADVGYYVGTISSAMYITQGCTSFIWGILADRMGVRNVMLLAALCVALTILAFGFTTSFIWALITRMLEGASMGVAAVTKSYMSLHCDDSNSPLALTILFAGYSAGYVVGPVIGGYLAFLSRYIPNISQNSFIVKFPVLLPNLVIAICLLVIIALGKLLLPKIPKTTDEFSNEGQDFYQKVQNLLILLRNRHLVISSISYGLVGAVMIGFLELYPLFASTSTKYNGLDYTPRDIALQQSIISVPSILITIIVFPKILKRYSAKQAYLFSIAMEVIAYAAFPSVHLIENKKLQWIVVCIYLFLVTYIFDCMCLLAVNILINNSVPDHQNGTANGIAGSVSSFGSVTLLPSFIGALMAGTLYAWSLKNIKGIAENTQALGFPFNQYFAFVILSMISILNGILVSLLPESINRKFDSSLSYK